MLFLILTQDGSSPSCSGATTRVFVTTSVPMFQQARRLFVSRYWSRSTLTNMEDLFRLRLSTLFSGHRWFRRVLRGPVESNVINRRKWFESSHRANEVYCQTSLRCSSDPHGGSDFADQSRLRLFRSLSM